MAHPPVGHIDSRIGYAPKFILSGACTQMQEATIAEFMSDEDVLKAKGKNLAEYQECRDRLRALEGEAARAAKMFNALARFLNDPDPAQRFATGGLEEYLNPKTITLLNDLHNTRNECERLRRLVGV